MPIVWHDREWFLNNYPTPKQRLIRQIGELIKARVGRMKTIKLLMDEANELERTISVIEKMILDLRLESQSPSMIELSGSLWERFRIETSQVRRFIGDHGVAD